jgi:hypothetical protein
MSLDGNFNAILFHPAMPGISRTFPDGMQQQSAKRGGMSRTDLSEIRPTSFDGYQRNQNSSCAAISITE